PPHSEIALSFFNALLSPQSVAIASLEFFTPDQLARAFGRRETGAIVARATYEDGSAALIDAKILNLPTFGKRLLFDTAKTYCSQLSQQRQDPEILPVVALLLLDFDLFGAEADLISRFALCEMEQQFVFPDRELSLVFVELPKFSKSLETLETSADRWLYFLRHAPQLDEIPDVLATEQALQQLSRSLTRANSPAKSWTSFSNNCSSLPISASQWMLA
ncbi:MAG: Rpn family recombination-promoting nuclease/putative transposase, partial [Spirulinaceae cyanobacterium RM2_2_10]|nr:Rpn family recombination-promoting nuclease/putative transposase [Spirulinaceae cyanobacterium RM2_2_10]